MARYTGPDCKRCRREKMKLFLKGSKCDGPKCPFESRPFPPGQHGRGRPKETEYLLQLREKQKARRIYGILEKQFRGYYEEAVHKQGKTGEVLLQILDPPGQRGLPAGTPVRDMAPVVRRPRHRQRRRSTSVVPRPGARRVQVRRSADLTRS